MNDQVADQDDHAWQTTWPCGAEGRAEPGREDARRLLMNIHRESRQPEAAILSGQQRCACCGMHEKRRTRVVGSPRELVSCAREALVREVAGQPACEQSDRQSPGLRDAERPKAGHPRPREALLQASLRLVRRRRYNRRSCSFHDRLDRRPSRWEGSWWPLPGPCRAK